MKIQSLSSSRYIRVLGSNSIHAKPRMVIFDLDKVCLIAPDIINNSGKIEDPPYIYTVIIVTQGATIWIPCEDDDEVQNIYDRLTELLVNYAGINIVNTAFYVTHTEDEKMVELMKKAVKKYE
jgi:hypothetical protein